MKNNPVENKFHWIYLFGFFIILSLPILAISPWFFPLDWVKTVIFRSILSIMLFLFAWQFLYKKETLHIPNIKNNKIVWALGGLFSVFLMATIFSADPYFSLWGSPYRGRGFVSFAFYFVFAILVFILFKKEDWKKAWNLSLITGILVSLVAIIQYYGLFDRIFLPMTRPSSTIGNPILLAIYLLLLIFVTIVFFIKEKRLPYKIWYGLSVLLFTFVILISQSRAAYLGCLFGAIYFLLFYPKKLRILKISALVFLLFIGGIIFYANTQLQFPAFLEKNRLFQSVQPRLLINLLLNEGRFPAWSIGFKAFLEKPLLGWGPENFSVGWDKYYNPAQAPWWDKAHNIFLDIATETGIIGLISYLALFIVIFWQLYKLKKPQIYTDKNIDLHKNTQIMAHGIIASLIGYLTANFFSFDSFVSHLIFFLLLAYIMRLAQKEPENNYQPFFGKSPKYKKAVMGVSAIVLALFLWNYNIIPFYQNIQINFANNSAKAGECETSLDSLENIISKSSVLASYGAMQYGDIIQQCASRRPENEVAYAKRAIPIIQRATLIQPLFTRFWILLGGFTATLAEDQKNLEIKSGLISQSNEYFNKALALSPLRPELFLGIAKLKFAEGNYPDMKSKAEKCLELNPMLESCRWIRIISNIYLNNLTEAKEDITLIKQGASLRVRLQLINAYLSVNEYKEIALLYATLVRDYPNVIQYRASLAEAWRQTGQYAKAKEEALMILHLAPETKEDIRKFLQTLPLGYR